MKIVHVLHKLFHDVSCSLIIQNCNAVEDVIISILAGMDSHVGQMAGEQLAQSTETTNFKLLHTIHLKVHTALKPDEF